MTMSFADIVKKVEEMRKNGEEMQMRDVDKMSYGDQYSTWCQSLDWPLDVAPGSQFDDLPVASTPPLSKGNYKLPIFTLLKKLTRAFHDQERDNGFNLVAHVDAEIVDDFALPLANSFDLLQNDPELGCTMLNAITPGSSTQIMPRVVVNKPRLFNRRIRKPSKSYCMRQPKWMRYALARRTKNTVLLARLRMIIDLLVRQRLGEKNLDVFAMARFLRDLRRPTIKHEMDTTTPLPSEPETKKESGNTVINVGQDIDQASVLRTNYATNNTHSMIDYLDRWHHYDNFDWKTTQGFNTKVFSFRILSDLFDKMEGTPFVLPFINAQFFSGTLEFLFTINTNQFMKGQLLICPIYGTDDSINSDNSAKHVYLMSQKPHVLLNAGGAQEAILRVPFKYPMSKIHITPISEFGQMSYATIYCRVLSNLLSAKDLVSTTNVTVAVRLAEHSFSGMINANLKPQTYDTMKHEMLPAAVNIAAKLLAPANCDFPPAEAPRNKLVPLSVPCLSLGTSSVDVSERLRLDGQGYTPHLVDPIDFDWSKVAQTYGIIDKFSIATNHTIGQIVYTKEVSPLSYKNSYAVVESSDIFNFNTYAVPPVGVLASMQGYFRGSLEYKFNVVSSAFHACKIIVAFIPGPVMNTKQITPTMLRSSYHQQYDILVNKEFTFEVPYISNQVFYPRLVVPAVGEYIMEPYGYIYIQIVSNLYSTDMISNSIDVIVYQRAGKDFELSVLNAPALLPAYDRNDTHRAQFIVVRAKTGYYPYYCSSWHSLSTGGAYVPIIRYGNVSDHVAQFTTPHAYSVYKIRADTFKNTTKPFMVPSTVDGKSSSAVLAIVPISDGTYVYAIPFASVNAAQRFAQQSARDKNWGDLKKVVETYVQCKLLLIDGTATSDYYDSAIDNPVWEFFVSFINEMSPTGINQLAPKMASMHFGEDSMNLKDICRRQQLYCEIDVKKVNPLFTSSVILPITPWGLGLDESFDNVSASRSLIGVIGSGFLFFKGSLRFTIVIDQPGVRFWVQHRFDDFSDSSSVRLLEDTSVPYSGLSQGYAFTLQDSSVNTILQVEVPYYSPCDRVWAGPSSDKVSTYKKQMYNLGSLVFGFSKKCSVNIFYSFGDDAAFSDFMGFPAMMFSRDIGRDRPHRSHEMVKGFKKMVTNLDKMGDMIDQSPTVIDDVSRTLVKAESMLDYAVGEVKQEMTRANNTLEAAVSSVHGQVDAIHKDMSGKVDKVVDSFSHIEKDVSTATTSFVESSEKIVGSVEEVKTRVLSIADSLQSGSLMKSFFSANSSFMTLVFSNMMHCMVGGSDRVVRHGVVFVVSVVANIFDLPVTAYEQYQQLMTGWFSKDKKSECYVLGTPVVEPTVLSHEMASGSEFELDCSKDMSLADMVSTFVGVLLGAVAAKEDIRLNRNSKLFKGDISAFLVGLPKYVRGASEIIRFIQKMWELLTNIFKKLSTKLFPQTAIIDPLLKNFGAIHDWHEEVHKLSHPDTWPAIKTQTTMQTRVELAYQYGLELHFVLANIDRASTLNKLRKLIDVNNTYLKDLRQKCFREKIALGSDREPFFIYMWGPPGVGKSTLKDYLGTGLLRAAHVPVGDQTFYNVPLNQEYWTNCMQQPIAYVDDFNLTVGDENTKMYTDLISLKSSTVFVPNQAAVEDKGRPYCPEIMYVCSNSEKPIIKDINEIGAFLRRPELYVQVRLIKEHRDNNITKISDFPESMKSKSVKNFAHLEFGVAQRPSKLDHNSVFVYHWYDYKNFIQLAAKMFISFRTKEIMLSEQRFKQHIKNMGLSAQDELTVRATKMMFPKAMNGFYKESDFLNQSYATLGHTDDDKVAADLTVVNNSMSAAEESAVEHDDFKYDSDFVPAEKADTPPSLGPEPQHSVGKSTLALMGPELASKFSERHNSSRYANKSTRAKEARLRREARILETPDSELSEQEKTFKNLRKKEIARDIDEMVHKKIQNTPRASANPAVSITTSITNTLTPKQIAQVVDDVMLTNGLHPPSNTVELATTCQNALIDRAITIDPLKLPAPEKVFVELTPEKAAEIVAKKNLKTSLSNVGIPKTATIVLPTSSMAALKVPPVIEQIELRPETPQISSSESELPPIPEDVPWVPGATFEAIMSEVPTVETPSKPYHGSPRLADYSDYYKGDLLKEADSDSEVIIPTTLEEIEIMKSFSDYDEPNDRSPLRHEMILSEDLADAMMAETVADLPTNIDVVTKMDMEKLICGDYELKGNMTRKGLESVIFVNIINNLFIFNHKKNEDLSDDTLCSVDMSLLNIVCRDKLIRKMHTEIVQHTLCGKARLRVPKYVMDVVNSGLSKRARFEDMYKTSLVKLKHYWDKFYECSKNYVLKAAKFLYRYKWLLMSLGLVAGMSTYFFGPKMGAICLGSGCVEVSKFAHRNEQRYDSKWFVMRNESMETKAGKQARAANARKANLSHQMAVLDEQVFNIVARNTFFLSARNDDGSIVTSSRVLCVGGRKIVMPLHYAEHFSSMPSCKFTISNKTLCIPITLDNILDFEEYSGSSLVSITLPPQFPACRDMTKYFYTGKGDDKVSSNVNGHVLVCGVECNWSYYVPISLGAVNVDANETMSSVSIDLCYEYPVHRQGMCGSVLVSGQKILGMHVAGGAGVGAAEPFNDLIINVHGQYVLDGYPSNIEDECVLNYEGNYESIGTVSKSFTSFNPSVTDYEETPFIKEFDCGMKPASLSPFSNGTQKVYPLTDGVAHHLKDPIVFDEELLDVSCKDYGELLLRVGTPRRSTVGVTTMEQALDGFINNDRYGSIDRSTSVGWPYIRMGSGWNSRHSLVGKPGCSDIKPEFREIVLEQIEKRKRGRMLPVVFDDKMKDELLPLEKTLKKGGTRIVSCCPIDYLIATRMYMQDFIVMMSSCNYATECAVGTNTLGKDWHNMLCSMFLFSPVGFDGDYSKFGPSLSSQVVNKCIDIINSWYSLNNTDKSNIEEENRVRKMLIMECMQAFHLASSYMYRTVGGSPSGAPFTVVLNSMVNSIYLRMAYYNLNRSFETFYQTVKIMTYGDDVLVACRNEQAFNFDIVQKFLAANGIKFTLAEKSDASIKLRKLWNCTFLKSEIVKSVYMGQSCFVYKLEKNSILKSICFVRKNNYFSSYEQLSQNVCNSLMFAVAHGCEFYDHLSTIVKKVFLKNYQVSVVIPPYAEAHALQMEGKMRDSVNTLKISFVKI